MEEEELELMTDYFCYLNEDRVMRFEFWPLEYEKKINKWFFILVR